MRKFTMTTNFTSRRLATSYKILVARTEFLVALATTKAQFRTLRKLYGEQGTVHFVQWWEHLPPTNVAQAEKKISSES